VFTITPNFVNTANDVFAFSTAGMQTTSDANLAKADVDRINVFPNPYYGFNTSEISRLNKYMTFNHLPATGATIRIFTLAGLLVRKIDHTNGTQFERWDLRNTNNLPVASGIYIAHIDMPDMGKTKILKIAIVQEEQVLPVY
jgi:hypothetical protein